MGQAVPTLDTNGWVAEPSAKARIIWNDYLATNFSQSDIHRGTLRSLPFAIAAYPLDMIGLKIKISDDLSTLYGAYSDGVSVSVDVTDVNNGTEQSFFNIDIRVQIQEGLGIYNLGELLKVANGQILNVNSQ